jgi:hypothetical protein
MTASNLCGLRDGQRPAEMRPVASRLLTLLLLVVGGPAGAEYRLSLDGVLGAWRHDDYFQRGEAVAEPRTLAGGGLRLAYTYTQPRLELGLDYEPTHRRDLDDSQTSATSHLLGFTLRGMPTERTTWTVSERLIQSDTFELVEAVEPESTLIPERSDRTTHRLHVDVAHDLSRRALLVAGADHSARLYEEDRLFDGRSLGAFVGGGWRLDPRQQLHLVARARRFDVRFGGGDAEQLAADLVYRAELGRRGRLELEGGGYRVELPVEVEEIPGPLPEPGDDQAPPAPTFVRDQLTGWHGAAELALDGDRVDGRAGYGHYVGSGAGVGRPLLVDELSAGLGFRLHPDLGLGIDARHTRSELLAERSAANRVSVASATLRWAVLARLSLAAGYSVVRQESRIEGFADVDDSRWFANAGFRIFELGAHPEREERP